MPNAVSLGTFVHAYLQDRSESFGSRSILKTVYALPILVFTLRDMLHAPQEEIIVTILEK